MHLRPKGIGDRGISSRANSRLIRRPSNALTAERHWRPEGLGEAVQDVRTAQ